jgi:hypothetical protein
MIEIYILFRVLFARQYTAWVKKEYFFVNQTIQVKYGTVG